VAQGIGPEFKNLNSITKKKKKKKVQAQTFGGI
jgi:hypothetical protein